MVALLINIFVTAVVIGTLAVDEAPMGQACGGDLGRLFDEVTGGACDYVELRQLQARRARTALGADGAAEQAAAGGESGAGLEVGPDDVKTDAENTMPVEEAQSLDELTMSAHPDVLPQAPSMYPNSLEALDAAIAPKLYGLSRHSLIRLPDGTEVPYWQTHQYANRHFRLTISRWREGRRGRRIYDVLSEAQKIKIWATHARMRKIMCSETFRTWVLSSTFEEGNTPEGVYTQFEGVPQGSFISMRDIPGRANAAATGKGVIIDNVRFYMQSDNYFLGTYAHERAHNLGYSHASQVPYPIGRWFTRLAGPGNVSSYESYDLSQHPEFEVVAAS